MKNNNLEESLSAAEALENEYKKYRQNVAIEELKIIQKEQAKEKIKKILENLKQECEGHAGFMAAEMKNILENCLRFLTTCT